MAELFFEVRYISEAVNILTARNYSQMIWPRIRTRCDSRVPSLFVSSDSALTALIAPSGPSLPTLQDKITFFEGSEKLMERSPSNDKELRRFDTGRFVEG